jgi:hypothetical protein
MVIIVVWLFSIMRIVSVRKPRPKKKRLVVVLLSSFERSIGSIYGKVVARTEGEHTTRGSTTLDNWKIKTSRQ